MGKHTSPQQDIMIVPSRVCFEHCGHDVLGIGTATPRLSWTFSGEDQDCFQTAYQLELCYAGGENVQSATIWEPQNSLVAWPFSPLESRQSVSVRVRVQSGNEGQFSAWSQSSFVETGLLRKEDWTCSILVPPFSTSRPNGSRRPVVFHRTIALRGPPVSARMYITSYGVYQARANGSRVGDHILAPGWTSYRHRLLYQTYDILSYIDSMKLNIDVTVAEGWYCGRLGWGKGRQDIYGHRLGLIAKVCVNYTDGTSHDIPTDAAWTCSFGPILEAGLYDGQVEDLRISATDRQLVNALPLQKLPLAPVGPPIRVTTRVKVEEVLHSPSGKVILDFGRNFVGRLQVYIKATTGQTITFTHAEVLEAGEIGTRPLRCAKARDIVTTSGVNCVWEPAFTLHGFRYVQVDGWPGELHKEDFGGIVTHSDMKRTGTFECSNPLLNKLHENVVSSMRSNFVSIPTDCPQRDERLGWTGDINVFADTANYLYDTNGMLASWLQDVRDEQNDAGGIVPLTVPHVVSGLDKEAHAIWGDVIIMLPWSLYQAYGDTSILQDNYQAMKTWLATIPKRTNGLWNYTSAWKLGDWLDPFAPPEDPGNSITDPTLVSDAFLIHCVDIMVDISRILGKSNEADSYAAQGPQLRSAFTHEYVTPAGKVSSDTQTAYVLAIHFGLLSSPEQYRHASERLAYLVRHNSRFCIATGFAGTPYIGHAMSKAGLTNLFYRMLLHRQCPSWLYPVAMGATSIWERWDSMLPNGAINPGEMTSFNHYALGSVANWMHAHIIGLSPVQSGWVVFNVQPRPGGGLTWARGTFLSRSGLIEVSWQIVSSGNGQSSESSVFVLRLTVPPNTRAYVRLPGSEEVEKKASGKHVWRIPSVLDEDWPPRASFPPSLQANDELPADPILPPPIEE